MTVAAIVAEYNPFHNGHAYHIEETRRQTGADYILAILSGDFVQRGEPAILDKYTRARMALKNGADLVLELPAAYACASAETFAAGAVATLHRLGVVDVLSYGSEYKEEALFSRLASLYLTEPEGFSRQLRALLRLGCTYPQARAQATAEWLAAHPAGPGESVPPDILKDLLSSPNSILAIEYHKALLALGSTIRPLAISRRGGYHDLSLPKDGEPGAGSFASASALRRLLSQNGRPDEAGADEALSGQAPESVLKELRQSAGFITAEDFSAALGYALLTTPADCLSQYADLDPDLARRIANLLPRYQGWQSFTDLVKTRQLTRSRVSRALLHLLLGLRQEDMANWAADGYAYYARLLGFRRLAAPLLTAIRKKSSVLLLARMAQAERSLDLWYKGQADVRKRAGQLLRMDLQAARLYETMAAVRFGRKHKNEYSHGLILL